LDVGWADLRLVDPEVAHMIGLDFNSQFVVGFVAVCVEGFLDHVGERSDESGFVSLGRDVFSLVGMGDGGEFLFMRAHAGGQDRMRLYMDGKWYELCYMWLVVLVLYGVAPLAGQQDAAALQLKVSSFPH
jgi:hypothetical protein